LAHVEFFAFWTHCRCSGEASISQVIQALSRERVPIPPEPFDRSSPGRWIFFRARRILLPNKPRGMARTRGELVRGLRSFRMLCGGFPCCTRTLGPAVRWQIRTCVAGILQYSVPKSCELYCATRAGDNDKPIKAKPRASALSSTSLWLRA
jgi:hypothetical protein